MKLIKKIRFAAMVIIAVIIAKPLSMKAQSVHNEQYIALQNWLLPQYKITFGAPVTLLTNYTFLLPDAAPTGLNQTLVVTSMVGSTYTLGWAGANANTNWLLTGNSGLTALNFIGTTDANDFIVKTNSVERMRVLSTGNVVIGTTLNPGQLQIQGSGGSSTFAAGVQLLNINYTLPTSAPTLNGQVLSSTTGGVMSWTSASSGTVSSVGLSLPSIFTVSGSPVTTSGTLTGTLANESANLVFAGPSSGVAATPTFRVLTTTDIPNLSGSYIANSTSLQTANFNISGNATIDGQLQIKGTSTGITTFQAGAQGATNINYTLPIISPTAGQILSSNASGVLSWTNPSNSGGTVTSVGLQMPSVLFSSVSNSPITSSGTLIPQLATQAANTVFAGPTSGANATPTFRALVATDIPSGSTGYIQNSTTLQTSSNFNISGNGTIDGQLGLKGTSTGVTTFTAGAQGTSNINYTLPTAQGTNGTVLQNNGSGVLSWVDQTTQVGAVQFAIKGSDQTITSSTTLTNDNDLSFTIGANETWELIAQMDVITNAVDTDGMKLKVAVTIPSGVLHLYASVTNGDGDDDCGGWLTSSGTTQTSPFEINGEDDKGPILIQGIIAGGSTGGTVHIQWAPSKSMTKTVTVKNNSYLKATKAK